MATLSERIKKLRQSANMTQEEFGKEFGIVKSTVSLYENGKSTPNDEIKKKICEYFNVSLDYLLGLSDSRITDYSKVIKKSKDSVSFYNNIVESPMTNSLIDAFKRLSIYNQYIILGKTAELLKEQKESEPDEQPSEDLSEVEKQLEEAIRTQKGDKNTKIG